MHIVGTVAGFGVGGATCVSAVLCTERYAGLCAVGLVTLVVTPTFSSVVYAAVTCDLTRVLL